MATTSITVSSQAASPPLIIDLRRWQKGVGLLLTFSQGASLTCTVQITGDNLQRTGYTPNTGNWNSHDNLVNITSSANGNLEYPVTGIRLNVTAWVSGSVTLSVVQAEG